MRKYRSKATKSLVSLKSLHSNCSCVGPDCLLKKRIVLVLPRRAECLNCDICAVFRKQHRPDHVIYLHIEGYKPQWVVVETKTSARDDHAAGQIKRGLGRMRDNPQLFAVEPRPGELLGLLVRNRKKIRSTDHVLDRQHRLRYGGIVGHLRSCEFGTDLQKYMIPA